MSQLKYASLIQQDYTTSEKIIGCNNIDLVTITDYDEDTQSVISSNIGFNQSGSVERNNYNTQNYIRYNLTYYAARITPLILNYDMTVDSNTTITIIPGTDSDFTYYLEIRDKDYNTLIHSSSFQTTTLVKNEYKDLLFNTDSSYDLSFGTIYYLVIMTTAGSYIESAGRYGITDIIYYASDYSDLIDNLTSCDSMSNNSLYFIINRGVA